MGAVTGVLVADNQPTFCVGIQAILATADSRIQFVGEAHDLQQLYSLQREKSPHILLISANIAANSLVEQVAAWKQQFVGSQLLIMLAQANESCLYQLMTSGIDGCLLKTESPPTIIRAIHTLAQGGNYFSQSLVPALIQSNTTIVAFTETEKKLLPFMITEMTVEEIAFTLHMSERSVARHMNTICQKLNVTKRLGAAVQIVRLGLV